MHTNSLASLTGLILGCFPDFLRGRNIPVFSVFSTGNYTCRMKEALTLLTIMMEYSCSFKKSSPLSFCNRTHIQLLQILLTWFVEVRCQMKQLISSGWAHMNGRSHSSKKLTYVFATDHIHHNWSNSYEWLEPQFLKCSTLSIMQLNTYIPQLQLVCWCEVPSEATHILWVGVWMTKPYISRCF